MGSWQGSKRQLADNSSLQRLGMLGVEILIDVYMLLDAMYATLAKAVCFVVVAVEVGLCLGSNASCRR